MARNRYGDLADGNGTSAPAATSAAPTYNYGQVGTSQFDPSNPSVMGRVWQGTADADVNHVNIWMRSQPWYQQIVQQHGGNANSDDAKRAIMTAAQQHGVQVDEGNFEIDDAGNIHAQGHGLRNTLIVAGVVGATIATMGAAGVFAGAGAGAADGAAGVGAAAETAGADAALTSAGVSAAGAGAAEAGTAAGIGAGEAGAAGAGVGLGETAATTGLASGAGLPGAAIAPAMSDVGVEAGTTAGAIQGGLGATGGAGSTLGTVGKSLLGGGGNSWLGAGIQAGAGLLGTYMQSKAASDAAAAQLDFQKQALQYQARLEKYKDLTQANRYANLASNLQPFIASGQSANARMAQILGLPAPPSPGPQMQNPTYTQPAYPSLPGAGPAVSRGPVGASTTDVGSPGPHAARGAGQGVLMRAPTGEQQMVSPDQVQHYTSMGAQVVGGGTA